MNAPRFLAPGQQLLSLTLAVLLTSAVLFSLGAQADASEADAWMASQAAVGQHLCAAPTRAERS